jgi:subtilisin family serine protease
MRKSWLSLSVVAILLAAVLPFSNVSRAQEPDIGRPQATEGPEGEGLKPRAQRRSGPITVFVELTGQPTTVAYAARKNRGGTEAQAIADAQDALAQNVQAQQRLLPLVQSLGTPVVYRVQRVLNGIAVRADANQQASLARLPGVRKVTPIVTKYLDNATSVPLIGAPDVWVNRFRDGIFRGEGITIGVIDTGIDYLHTDFDGPGSGYETNDTTVVEAGGGFPNDKVVGGYDFAGDDYDARFDETSIPQPDPDPMDCDGHGTHVAGTATGLGVNNIGATFNGPYSRSTPFGALSIGPGVAPLADLYGLRVFGCAGSTDLTDQAIEYAVDPNGDGNFEDHLDVINMSLGSSYGGNEDTTAIASNNAALANVIVVASAGNSNDTTFITGSPGSASRAISTASSADSTAVTDGFRVNSPEPIARIHPAFFSSAYDWTGSPDVTGTLVYPESQPSGCQPFNAENQELIDGNIVLLQWTEVSPDVPECGSVARGTNVTNAGGIGIIMYDNSEIFDLSIRWKWANCCSNTSTRTSA